MPFVSGRATAHHDMGRSHTPIPSFLLRIVPRQETRRTLHYELRDLGSGHVHRFTSLLALRRFLSTLAPHERGVP